MARADIPPDDSVVTDRDPFRFTDEVRAEAWARQNGRCGICECSLRKQMKGNGFDYADTRVEAHHVISCRASKRRSAVESLIDFIKSANNCMYLCESCHQYAAHGGNHGNGGLRPPHLFKYSHGGQMAGPRLLWIAKASAEWIQLFGDGSELHQAMPEGP